MRTCDFPDCGRRHDMHGYCSGHNKQLERGAPLAPLAPKRVVKTYVEVAVAERPRHLGCWDDWPFAVIKRSGRPVMADPRKPGKPSRMTTVARYVTFLVEGAWPKSACHHCDNPRCWNPGHLYGGDQSTNNLDAIARGRRPGKGQAA